MATKVQKLDPSKTFAELFGMTGGESEIVHIVRILAIGIRTGKVVVVFNYREIRRDEKGAEKECARPLGWGMPGGVVELKETPLQAIKWHEGGEIPLLMIGEPVHLLDLPVKEFPDHTEQVHLFYVAVDEEKPTELPPEIIKDEGREVGEAKLLTIEEIIGPKTLAVRKGEYQYEDPEKEADRGKFYASHKGFYDRRASCFRKGFFQLAWERYREMKDAGEIPS